MSVGFIKFNYCVEGLSRYLSHKSRTRLIKMALRKCQVPVKYSQGFSPRIALIYCPPSPVGVSVDNDFFVLTIRIPLEESGIVAQLSQALPEGFRVHGMYAVDDISGFSKNILTAEYHVIFIEDQEETQSKLEDLLKRDSILLRRKGKKDKDVRPLIKDVELFESEGKKGLRFLLLSSQDKYLSPLDFMEILLEKDKKDILKMAKLTRKGFYMPGSKEYV